MKGILLQVDKYSKNFSYVGLFLCLIKETVPFQHHRRRVSSRVVTHSCKSHIACLTNTRHI
eukprot:jgi/Bigna1/62628/fgenesh1_kg.39_\